MGIKSKVESALTRFGVPSEQLGKTLIEQAQQEELKALGAAALSHVRELLRIVEDREQIIRDSKVIIERARKRIKALEAGEFTIARDGQIVFKNSDNNVFITAGL